LAAAIIISIHRTYISNRARMGVGSPNERINEPGQVNFSYHSQQPIKSLRTP
jgi:hypothetical protein